MPGCPHGDDAATCPPCRRAAGKSNQLIEGPPVEVEFTFTAKFDGQCPACDLPLSVGQQASHMADGRNLHEHCARSAVAS